MGKTLIIVESPHKAHTIQGFLGDEYIVMASKGHITDLAKGGRFGLGIDIENDFKPKYVLMDDKLDVLDQLLSAAKECDNILLASDNDREGEAISWHLQERLKDIEKPIKRVVFNEIKKSTVLKALKTPRDVDMDLFRAQEARRLLDRIVGFTVSPFLMSFFGPKLSAGRVQSVVARMVIDREREIEKFVPEDFWTIQVNLSQDNKNAFTAKYFYKICDSETADEMKSRLSEPEYVVTDVIAREEKVNPPPPLITLTLQRLMSREYSMSPDSAMKAAQALYEQGYISYLRTDSVRASDESIEEVRQWMLDNNHRIPTKPNEYKNSDEAQDAHECIRPVDISLIPDNNMAIIDSDEKKVYKAVWRYFVASQSLPAVYNTLKVSLSVANDSKCEVKATGKALKSAGFLDVLGKVDSNKIDIPNLSKGDSVKLFGKNPVLMEKKKTQGPARFSEDKLIKQLADTGVGRPATYSDLLTKITTRNYVEKKGDVYHPTDLGKKISDELTKDFSFMNFAFTANMEKKLDLIAQGKLNYIDVLKEFYIPFKAEVDKAYMGNGGTLCPKCGAPMRVQTRKSDGNKFMGCSKFPKCKEIVSI